MTASIVTRGVAGRRRSVLGYGVGLGLMIVWVMAIYPSVQSQLPDYIDAMPEAMKSLFGMDDITSLAGFVHAEVFSLMGPLVFLAFAVSTGSSTIAGEEQDHILSIVLATGVGRRSLLLSKLAALAVELAALGAMTLSSLLVGSALAGGGIGVAAATAAVVQLALLGMFFGTLALTIGAATGRKSAASAITVAVALATYLVDGLANIIGWLEPMQVLSPFHWYTPSNPLLHGVPLGGLTLLVACTAALVTVGVVVFDRRDIGT